MRALITGGCGFIGHHLAEELLKRGHDVTILDDCSTGRWIPPKEIMFHKAGVEDIEAVLGFAGRFDIIYHLAAAVGVKTILAHPARSMITNLAGTHAVLQLAMKQDAILLFASTSEVYGKSAAIPFHEDADLVIGPSQLSRWGYAASKLADEHLALAYHQEFGLRAIIVRLFNVVGPGQLSDYGMVLPRFIDQALNGESLTVYGDGSQSRCFIDVQDVVKALVALPVTPETIGEIFNVGNTQPITIMELAEKVQERVHPTTGQSDAGIIQISYNDAYKDPGFQDMMARAPSIDKIRQYINWEPTTTLEQTIDRIILCAEKRAVTA